jgi:hypothetical protein
MTVSHVCLVVKPSEFEARKAFYTTVLVTLNYKEFRSSENFIAFADASGTPDFFIIAKEESERGPTTNVHFGFRAPDRETVHKFHEVAL